MAPADWAALSAGARAAVAQPLLEQEVGLLGVLEEEE
jgi:hypothetical protein